MLTGIKNGYSLVNPVYIGDTDGDAAAATEANIEFIHAGWGFGRPASGTKSLKSFTELPDYLMRQLKQHIN
jgi:phosphoglycolate phosphatase